MEAFSLLKYWRGGAATSSAAVHGGATAGDSDNSDEGPFFDLKLSVPLETGSNGSPDSEEKELSPEEPEPIHNGFSRLKSATNFRVLLLKLKKNSDNKVAKPEKSSNSSSSSSSSSSKFFTVKFKVEEIPTRSVFKRENSSNAKKNNERRFSKEMQRYLKMVSKRYGGERFSGETEEGGERRRRDDSLVQQQDGIQSAILHCKRSFNSSRDAEMSILSRSVSDPSQKSSEEFKEKGL